LGKLYFLSDA
jgi:endo-1,4-beta-xylanase